MWTSCNKTWFVRITASFNCGHHVTKKRQSGQSIFFNCGCRVTKYCLSCKITDFKCGHFVTKKLPIFRTLIQIQATLPVFRHFRTKKNFSLYIIGAHFTSCPHLLLEVMIFFLFMIRCCAEQDNKGIFLIEWWHRKSGQVCPLFCTGNEGEIMTYIYRVHFDTPHS